MFNNKFTKQSSKLIHETKWLRLTEDKLTFPDGNKGVYTYMSAIEGVVVIAINKKNEFLLVNEYRYPIQKYIWHFITGGVHKHDTPLSVAKAELEEEAGYIAQDWQEIGKFYHAPGVETTQSTVFIAKDLQPIKDAIIGNGDEDIAYFKFVSRAVLSKLISQGNLSDGLSLSGLKILEESLPKSIIL